MDRPTTMKTFKYDSSEPPIFSVMETSLHYRSFTQNNNVRDVSFSSYLRPTEPKPTSQEDVGCTVDDSEISIFDAQKYFNERDDPKDTRTVSSAITNLNLKRAVEGYELPAVPRLSSASSADGYSNSRNYRVRSFHATPTASSEASWNSQTGLLSNPPGAIAVSLRNLPTEDLNHRCHHHGRKTGSGAATKWFFRGKCPCIGKKSVRVEEPLPEPATPPVGLNSNNGKGILSNTWMAEKLASKSQKSNVINEFVERQEKEIQNSQRLIAPANHFASNVHHHHHHHHHQLVLGSERPSSDGTGGFSFPSLNQSSAKMVRMGLEKQSMVSSGLEDLPRDSLEVFQPLEESVSRKFIMASNDKDPPGGFTFPGSPISRVTATATEDDVASEASSDLFEIDSFSTQKTSFQMYHHRRDSLDEAPTFNAKRFNGNLFCRRSVDEPTTPSIVPTECYEPSEASIDWSVTTAEGFDRSSVTNFSVSASEIEDVAITRRGWDNGGGGGGGGIEWGKRKGNGLLSCRHEKAVSVGPQPVKCGAEEQGATGGPSFP